MLYGIDVGRPVGVRWAQTERRVGGGWARGGAQAVVWGAAGGCLGAAGGCPGAAGDTYWHALADLDPNKAPKGSTEVALGRLNASPRPARDISKAEKVEK